jgi:hypothetical protein
VKFSRESIAAVGAMTAVGGKVGTLLNYISGTLSNITGESPALPCLPIDRAFGMRWGRKLNDPAAPRQLTAPPKVV